jgi:hypothetical protein
MHLATGGEPAPARPLSTAREHGPEHRTSS